MLNFYEDNGRLQVYGGCSIEPTIAEGITIAHRRGEPVMFDFNGISVTVYGDSDSALILRDWRRALNGYIGKGVGPYPAAELTDAERAHDAEIAAAHQVRRATQQAEYDKQQRAKEAAMEVRISTVSALDLANAEAWAKFKAANTDGYGGAVVTYAERWARLMQAELAEGARLEDIADRLSSEADIEGITGFMYGCAVSTLAKCWKHGEALRRWHNLKTQIGHEGEKANESGGVLNPALLNLG